MALIHHVRAAFSKVELAKTVTTTTTTVFYEALSLHCRFTAAALWVRTPVSMCVLLGALRLPATVLKMSNL